MNEQRLIVEFEKTRKMSKKALFQFKVDFRKYERRLKMLLTESKIIKNKKIFKLIDKYSYQAKNLYNACNYIIKQASRISYKLSKEEILEE